MKRAQLLKIKAQLSSIWAKGCILMTVCVFYLTSHDYDYPSLVYGESHGKLLLYTFVLFYKNMKINVIVKECCIVTLAWVLSLTLPRMERQYQELIRLEYKVKIWKYQYMWMLKLKHNAKSTVKYHIPVSELPYLIQNKLGDNSNFVIYIISTPET